MTPQPGMVVGSFDAIASDTSIYFPIRESKEMDQVDPLKRPQIDEEFSNS